MSLFLYFFHVTEIFPLPVTSINLYYQKMSLLCYIEYCRKQPGIVKSIFNIRTPEKNSELSLMFLLNKYT